MSKRILEKELPDSFDFPLILFREDLDHLVQILLDKGIHCEFICGEFKFKTLDEIEKEYGKKLKDLVIKSAPQSAQFTLNFPGDGHARLIYFGNDRNLIHEIREYLSTKKNKFIRIFANPLVPSILFLIFLFSGEWLEDYALESWNSPYMFKWAFSLTMTTVGLYFLYCVRKTLYRPNSINLYRKYEGSYFKRNKEKIVFLIIGTVLGTLGTLIAQHFN